MFSRARAFEFRSSYMSRYNYMMETGDPVDRANAECCRLASQAWQDIAQFSQRPDLVDDQGNPWEFDPESVIADIKSQWEDYCRTGVPRNDVDELAAEIRARHPQELADRRKAYLDRHKPVSRDPVQDFGIMPLEPKEITQTNQKGKKIKKSESENISTVSSSEQVQSIQRQEPELERMDEENRKHIQEDAIEVVINEIRMELSTEMQELHSQTF
jgi:hypothetical protein